MSGETQRWVAVARILRPRGNKGEVAAELLTDFPERLTQLREVYLQEAGGNTEPRRTALQACWLPQSHSRPTRQIVFHFENYASISDAEKLRGREVWLPMEQRVQLPTGHYFVSDLVGCSVFELAAESPAAASSPCSLASAPTLLGTVREVQFPGDGMPGTPLLAVETGQGEVLIPLAADICTRIETAARRIEVSLPEGLRDLNFAGNHP